MKTINYLLFNFILFISVNAYSQNTNNEDLLNIGGFGGLGRNGIAFPTVYYNANANYLRIAWEQTEGCRLTLTNQSGDTVFSSEIITDGLFYYYSLPTLQVGTYKVEFYSMDEIICYSYIIV